MAEDHDEFPETEIMQSFKPRPTNVVSSKNAQEQPCFGLRDLIVEKRIDPINKIESKVKMTAPVK